MISLCNCREKPRSRAFVTDSFAVIFSRPSSFSLFAWKRMRSGGAGGVYADGRCKRSMHGTTRTHGALVSGIPRESVTLSRGPQQRARAETPRSFAGDPSGQMRIEPHSRRQALHYAPVRD